ncbi:MAG: VIT domain-containing protein [Bradymonadaceae bacterium]
MGENAAVYEMIMQVGDRRIRAKIQEKEEARETFERARSEGRAAALLEQQRANLFTQKLANLMPNQPVRVTIRYVENVEKIDGRYQMVVPLVVGPRYEPADMSGNQLVDSGESVENERVVLPRVSELVAPETIDPDRIGLKVRLDGGVTVGAVESPSHAIATSTIDPRTRLVELVEGRTIGNRHFVLSYELEGQATQAGLLTHWNDDHGEGYFSLLVEPPARPKDDEIAAREMVFLLDVSGSMRGAPMETSKAYMRHTLRNLRPNDTFRIIRFANDTGTLAEEPLVATEENIERGLSYVNALEAGGGTRIIPGLMAAFGGDDPDDRVRIATVLHDGYFGNEYEVIRTVRREIGDTRLVLLGVGTGPNRFVFKEMALAGRGFSRYINPADLRYRPDAIRNTATAVAHKLETPVLTDISIDWGKLTPRETTPERIPDLFAGQSIRIMGRYDEPGDYAIEVRGRAGTEQVSIPLRVHLAGEGTDGRAVELTWARSRVDDYMHRLMTPHNLRQGALGDGDLKALVTDLGLSHDIATKWTSFVAVSEHVVNPNPGQNIAAHVPEPQVHGVPNSGYATMTRQNAAPEPGMLIGLLMALLMGLGLLQRTSRSSN